MRIIAGRFRGKALLSPSDDSIRPTSDRARESLFNIIASRLGPHLEGMQVLDLFAGTGALGLEAISRGASGAVFVDIGAEARGLIRDNIEALGAAGIAKLLRRDATSLGAAGTMGPFDLVFLDPPYGQGLGEKALASARGGGWFAPGALIVLEESADVDLDPGPGFVLEDRRVYGAAAIHLLRPEDS
ncbi:16S rRNA (guanine(966)-N(2))-methyltransferase RsmD [Arsenicitalea aurantiaca]|uniref:16S rRNA (Guanine(966)-N(2))-methyltransferase RsmD n=1 Tax=Arsenicitalea aurantiaca TaxID=1783274 RepID=A0A433XAU2_9HYPH|nr:16S rRNA (guanine(966)-N(2))-methyltransferase RsmD [Arsenicitalea aurantiaca]RUT31196.1 16S rRNA (guanine(966)-N(2))-methyltransferase RsmD [Arsenicitalea aurantiaca]